MILNDIKRNFLFLRNCIKIKEYRWRSDESERFFRQKKEKVKQLKVVDSDDFELNRQREDLYRCRGNHS